MKSEKLGRPIFYGSMITEGIVALIWATVAMYFFYGSPAPGMQLIEDAKETGFLTSAPVVVNLINNEWLGTLGGILALLGVVAAPITSGDTALRSCRLIIADFLHVKQKRILNRFFIAIPIFAVSFFVLMWQINNPNGFNVIWQFFGWGNQTLSVITLWMLTIYLAINKKPYFITQVPATFMLIVCTAFVLNSKFAFNLNMTISGIICAIVFVISQIWFFVWMKKNIK